MSQAQVLEFHTIFKAAKRETPEINVPEKDFRFDLIKEEVEELGKALNEDDMVEVADALGDIIYVTYGAGITFGLDLEKTVEVGRERAKEIDMYSKDANALFTREGRETVLRLLREALDSENINLVNSTLATIIVTVEYASLILGVPLTEVVDAIHQSNLSKLGSDGEPIFFEYNGAQKVGKGPNYKTPTEDIKRILGLGNVEA